MLYHMAMKGSEELLRSMERILQPVVEIMYIAELRPAHVYYFRRNMKVILESFYYFTKELTKNQKQFQTVGNTKEFVQEV